MRWNMSKYLVLGVSFNWEKRKGLDVFIELEKRLGLDYKIVLVGADENLAYKIPERIITIPRTADQEELARLYSAANVFINPTREDNFPTVNIESLACGTPVITFHTGGSAEMLDNGCGYCVETDDYDELVDRIVHICESGVFSEEACIKRARQFDRYTKFKEYVDLYDSLLGRETG